MSSDYILCEDSSIIENLLHEIKLSVDNFERKGLYEDIIMSLEENGYDIECIENNELNYKSGPVHTIIVYDWDKEYHFDSETYEVVE